MRIAHYWGIVKYEVGLVWASLRDGARSLARRHPVLVRLLSLALVAQLIAVYAVMMYALVVA
ncbi:MAG: hypothetical protein Q3999_05215 [Buchananella hordeovulneris]|nr:hypothetical protein [Buchananella hordeovulneris]